MNRRLTWPEAFVVVFGAVPLTVMLLAAAVAYPAVVLPLCTGVGLFVLGDRAGRRRNALAQRAALDYPAYAAAVAAPLPDMPTVPNRLRR